ncbi:MAG: acetyl-CoA carboxylase biotin carboxylase subunit [Spirochaeta sp.]|jgi:acetyl-CoA carboxylase biotin carboxylase subunit|nr:acetyl-CoA carboxylase biotin carboxylase subunit [Spirochaeta sp.]
MISSILIANRGEIAVRIVRACREMGIQSVVAYSDADRHSLAVHMADDAVCIGPPAATDSYLNIPNLVSAAIVRHCDAIHPGVGFLSESARFAKEVTDAGLIFIGPPSETISMLGDKVVAKQTAIKHGVPVIPGSAGSVSEISGAAAAAEEIGYPVIVKAAAGGGGKGMRICRRPEDLAGILQIASGEAEKSFSDGTVYLEKYLTSPRHVELQVLADSFGTVVHLGERDCSVQENHQKLVEESPSTAVGDDLRARMGEDAIRMFSALDYVGAGTIEFLVEDGKHYFMEVNARVQVEHPVTELVTGVDIIAEQIRAAAGEPLRITQEDILLRGYALECRINAQAPGKVTHYYPPGGFGVRVDSFLHIGAVVPPFYDSLVAKLIVFGRDREEGLARMDRALSEFEIEGIPTNMERQRQIINSRVFQSGVFGTDALEYIKKEIGV